MTRDPKIVARAAELINLDENGRVENAGEVARQLEQEFNLRSQTAFNYVVRDGAKAARKASK
jgi:hypothetical protein